MPIFQLARKPTQWLRVALAALMLAFALNSVAHVTHRHDATNAAVAHTSVCSYCISFGGLAGEPRYVHTIPNAARADDVAAVFAEILLPARPQTSARPRAPPIR